MRIPGGDMGKLTDIQIRAWIKAGERFEQRGDGDGLYRQTARRRGVERDADEAQS